MLTKKRADVAPEDRWNVDTLYSSFAAWKKESDKATSSREKPFWPNLVAYQGRLGESAETLKSALDLVFDTSRKLSKIYTYAHLRHDEDIAHDSHKGSLKEALSLYHEFEEEASWVEPELISLPKETIDAYLNSPVLKDYKFHLEKIFRLKAHTLSSEGERLVALAEKALIAPHKAFSALNDADLKFGSVKDEKGEERQLSHALFSIYLHGQDRTLRKNAFTQMHKCYDAHANTLCELLNGQIQSHVFNTRARNYGSSLHAALFPKNIDRDVYHNLIETVGNEIGTLHRYLDKRKERLGVEELHLYDMYVPLVTDVDIKMSYKEAEEVVIESVAPLGADYQNALQAGLTKDRWVDRYENINKRSGAYSSGCYDSMPYILMNYKGLLRDVFTLAHEAGHSMHSYLSHQNQPYQYGDYPIFVAEVASTFNEELLHRLLIERCQSPEEKTYLINQRIEDIRATLFRQTMFAEFELMIHQFAETNMPLTPETLKKEYVALNKKYFGENVIIDEPIAIEWARIPHFYYNFYVYQYATGISAALALAERVLQGGDGEREDYLSFLKGGSSRYPLDLLRQAGVDMSSPEPIRAALARFDSLVTEL